MTIPGQEADRGQRLGTAPTHKAEPPPGHPVLPGLHDLLMGRPTKVHHIRRGSSNGSPPSRNTRAPQTGCRPGAQRFLQQPQAHDVAQIADRAVHAQLVGEDRGAPGLGEHRLVELGPTSDQVPQEM